MSILVENVSKSFGNQIALENVSFQVNSGEVAGFIGPNGAGKSTMMKIICTLLTPDTGSVKVNGTDISVCPLEIKRKLGYLPENNPLYPDMYVREYLLFVGGLYRLGRDRGRRVDEIIGVTGLAPEMHKKIGLLSKGYRQRVGLAQAILHDPDVLILDEPTSGLDPNQLVGIRNLISELGKEKTVILSTHIMQEVEAICRRVIILNKGRIVADELAHEIGSRIATTFRTIVVEFQEDPPEDIFYQVEGIDIVRKLKNGTLLVQTIGDDDIRARLFKTAVSHNLVILSMHQKEKKLEDVFRELTR